MSAHPKRKRLYHTPPSWVADGAIFFITICCRERGSDVLIKHDIAKGIRESLAFRQTSGRWNTLGCVLMPDHLHAILGVSAASSLATEVTAWKRYTARTLSLRWQRGFFDHRIRNRASLAEKWQYMRENPVKAGLVENPDQWEYFWGPVDLEQ